MIGKVTVKSYEWLRTTVWSPVVHLCSDGKSLCGIKRKIWKFPTDADRECAKCVKIFEARHKETLTA